jgi:hypothetical protein
MFKESVVVRTQFDGRHCWANCPIDDVAFLKNDHRHKFFVEVKVPVSHDDRDVEFFMFKGFLDRRIEVLYPQDNNGIKILASRSCEMVAKEIMESMVSEEFNPEWLICSVFEDNENGAEVEWIRR